MISYEIQIEELIRKVGKMRSFKFIIVNLIKLGPLPVNIGFELYCYVEKADDFGPEWMFRFLFVPVLPAPEWRRKPVS